jgi:hypothetical protein
MTERIIRVDGDPNIFHGKPLTLRKRVVLEPASDPESNYKRGPCALEVADKANLFG